MSFTIGQKVTTNRGKNGKGEAEVVAGPDSDGKYVVKDEQGNFHTKPEKSLKALPERTFTESEVRNVLASEFGQSFDLDEMLRSVARRLGVDLGTR